jgi:hypothetical protein
MACLFGRSVTLACLGCQHPRKATLVLALYPVPRPAGGPGVIVRFRVIVMSPPWLAESNLGVKQTSQLLGGRKPKRRRRGAKLVWAS